MIKIIMIDDATLWSKHELYIYIYGYLIFRSTSESRPNSIEGKNVRPPVRTSVRPSVRPSVHKKCLQFE